LPRAGKPSNLSSIISIGSAAPIEVSSSFCLRTNGRSETDDLNRVARAFRDIVDRTLLLRQPTLSVRSRQPT
jgi:hypothetical protein